MLNFSYKMTILLILVMRLLFKEFQLTFNYILFMRDHVEDWGDASVQGLGLISRTHVKRAERGGSDF